MTEARGEAGLSPRTGAWRWGLVVLALLSAGGLFHLLYLVRGCPLDLSGDEAHYWEWSRRLDLSYYSKGPLVAYIIAAGRALLAGWSEHTVGNESLAVRVPAILLSIGSGLGIYVLAVGTLRQPKLAAAAVALTFTIPILAVGAILMTIDAPLAFCFVWALVACQHGLARDHTWAWLVAGVLIAVGLLAKYTMVLVFPIVGLALLTEPPHRRQLRRPGPYLAVAIGLLGLVPILVWNTQHGWVSFRHVAGQAGVAGRTTFDPGGLLDYVGGQAAVIGPVWFAGMVLAVAALWKAPRPRAGEAHAPEAIKLLLYATAVPWAAFLVFSPITKVQPNWPVLAVPPGAVLLVFWLARLRRRDAHGRRLANGVIVAGVLLGGGAVVAVHRMEWLLPVLARFAPPESPWNLTPLAKLDPTARLRGWSQLGAAVGSHLRLGVAGDPEPFIVTDDYQAASEIAFYCPGEPDVYCLQSVLGDRQSQYDIWPNPIRDAERFIGRPCIYIGVRKPELFGGGRFAHVALPGATLAETVEHRVRGHLLQVWAIYSCPEFAGLPPELRHNATTRY